MVGPDHFILFRDESGAWAAEPSEKPGSRLSPAERAKHYRILAGDARLKAAKCNGQMQAALIQIAGHWEWLAREAEA
jgi:hypothetical protein